MTEKKVYLGDGVYAEEVENNTIILTTIRYADKFDEEEMHYIYLSPNEIKNLFSFIKSLENRDEAININRESGRGE